MDRVVVYSFALYLMYVLIPMIPAVVIFHLFPDSKVAATGPLQNVSINVGGAFGAYVVTTLLALRLVNYVEGTLDYFKPHNLYAYYGTLVDLDADHGVACDRFFLKSVSFDPSRHNINYEFVVLLDHPVVQPEMISIKYYDNKKSGSGFGDTGPAPEEEIRLALVPSKSFPVRFVLSGDPHHPTIGPEAAFLQASNS